MMTTEPPFIRFTADTGRALLLPRQAIVSVTELSNGGASVSVSRFATTYTWNVVETFDDIERALNQVSS